MPKQKTHSGAKKRFAITGNGLIKKNKQNKNHILTKKDTKRKRRLRKGGYVNETQAATIRKKLMPYD
ncbi:MAG: 50S ribosomal protein L35 [Clostridiales bacterium]|jgi:large subunit ribosomal protein L35|nr:50S ribosomal protein L35 [Clostridiales bacterium]